MLSRLVIPLLQLISLLPLRFLYLLSDVLYIILYHLVKYRRAVVDSNLRNAFPEKSDAQRHLIAKKYYRYLCDLIIESVKMISISRSEVMERFSFTNPELLEEYFSKGKSVILAAGHYGNWEMASNIGLLTERKILVVYKPLVDPAFERFLKKVRSRFGARMVPMKTSFKEILSYRKEPTASIIVSDQTPAHVDSYTAVNFLNQPTAVFLGIERLSKAYNYPVLFCDVRVVKRGHYTCRFVPLVDEPKNTADNEITEKHTRYLEQIIREVPQYWIWSHKRWKFKPQ